MNKFYFIENERCEMGDEMTIFNCIHHMYKHKESIYHKVPIWEKLLQCILWLNKNNINYVVMVNLRQDINVYPDTYDVYIGIEDNRDALRYKLIWG